MMGEPVQNCATPITQLWRFSKALVVGTRTARPQKQKGTVRRLLLGRYPWFLSGVLLVC